MARHALAPRPCRPRLIGGNAALTAHRTNFLMALIAYGAYLDGRRFPAVKKEGRPDMDDALDNRIVLKDEDGNDCHFELLDFLEVDGTGYVVLLPEDQDSEGPAEVVILAAESTGNEDGVGSYVSVDDTTLVRVFELFKQRFSSQFVLSD